MPVSFFNKVAGWDSDKNFKNTIFYRSFAVPASDEKTLAMRSFFSKGGSLTLSFSPSLKNDCIEEAFIQIFWIFSEQLF